MHIYDFGQIRSSFQVDLARTLHIVAFQEHRRKSEDRGGALCIKRRRGGAHKKSALTERLRAMKLLASGARQFSALGHY